MRARRFLEARWIVVWAMVLGVLLTLPAVWGGLQSEDYVFRDVALTSDVELPFRVNLYGERERVDAETISGHNSVERTVGAQPWISSDVFHVSFWRPLASLTHILDYRVWPHWPWLMHVENLAWYALLIGSVVLLYRRLHETPWVAGLAGILYAVDDAHGHAVGWIANRNGIMAAVFGVLAIVAHDRWRRGGKLSGAILSPLLLAAALGCSEFALGAVGYLAAHVVWLDPAPPKRRVVAAAPWVAVVGLWAVVYRWLGHGARGSGVYLDPTLDPIGFLLEGPARVVALGMGQIAAPWSDLWAVVYPEGIALFAISGAAVLAVIVWILVPLLRRDAAMRFWGAGALLATLPACGALPEDRLLLFAGVGAAAVVARFLAAVWAEASDLWPRAGARIAARTLGALFVLLHLVAAPLLLPYRSLTMQRYDERLTRLSESAFSRIHNMRQVLVIANAPDFYLGAMMVMTRIARRDLIAHNAFNLVGDLGEAEIRGVDQNAVEVRPRKGFYTRPFNRIYRDRNSPLRPGQIIRYRGVEITVLEATPDGEPTAVLFRFEMALRDPRMRWVVWHEGTYHPLDPPKPGQTIVIGARGQ